MTRLDRHLQVFMDTARSCLNIPYKYAGNNPFGMDCSGFVCWCLRAAGIVRYNEDRSADGLWEKLRYARVDDPRYGAIVFWFDSTDKARHIGICISETHYYGAEGGGSRVKTSKDANLHNAFVRLAPLTGRSGEPRFVYPWDSPGT